MKETHITPKLDMSADEIVEMADDFKHPEQVAGACGYIKGDVDFAPRVETALRELAKVMRGGKVEVNISDVSQIPKVRLMNGKREVLHGYYVKTPAKYNRITEQMEEDEYVAYPESVYGGDFVCKLRKVKKNEGEYVQVMRLEGGSGRVTKDGWVTDASLDKYDFKTQEEDCF